MSHDKNVQNKKVQDKKVNESIIEGRNAVMEAFRSCMYWMDVRMVR